MLSVLDVTYTHLFDRNSEETDDTATLDLRDEIIALDRRPPAAPIEPQPQDQETQVPEHGPAFPEGVRVDHVRVGSVAKIAAVFFGVGHVAVLGALVVFWNVLRLFGFVTDAEELVSSSLGLESFSIDGLQLFELSALVIGVLFALGLMITVLLALVYNAACGLFGGVAIEVGPLHRAKRVFSPRHRRFVSVG